MGESTLKRLQQTLAYISTLLFTLSYAGAYRYYTLVPAKVIAASQHFSDETSKKRLIEALAAFRRTKEEELKSSAVAVRKRFLNLSIRLYQMVSDLDAARQHCPQEQ
jgi:hypothetical protein